MIPKERIQKFKDLTFSKKNIMIPKERIEQGFKEFNPTNNSAVRTGFIAGVRFAESELKLVSLKLLHYYRHKPFEFTEGKSNEEIFDMFEAERSNP